MAHHHHGPGKCSCEHDPAAADMGLECSLWKVIHTDRVVGYNERVAGSAASCFKPWDQRHDRTTFVESNEDDAQLIIYIPFTGVVKLKSIRVAGGPDGASPSRMKVWINRNDVDFSNADDLPPTQEWELVEDFQAEIPWETRLFKFQNVTSLTIYFPENFGADSSLVYYIGLTGEYQAQNRQPVIATYEARAQPADHKVADVFQANQIV